MTGLQGTGQELGRIPLGEYGEIIINDDGCQDADISGPLFEWPDGNIEPFRMAMNRLRRGIGDDAIADLFDATVHPDARDPDRRPSSRDVRDSGATVARGALYHGPGPFICTGCSKTWPSKHNQTPGDTQGTCPDCYEGDES